jgi:6-methylsalicylate decarboxylase
VTRKYPGRFGHFASLPLPDVAGCLDELRYALDELGSDGVIVLTNAHGSYLGDDSFEPLWAELSRRQRPASALEGAASARRPTPHLAVDQ